MTLSFTQWLQDRQDNTKYSVHPDYSKLPEGSRRDISAKDFTCMPDHERVAFTLGSCDPDPDYEDD